MGPSDREEPLLSRPNASKIDTRYTPIPGGESFDEGFPRPMEVYPPYKPNRHVAKLPLLDWKVILATLATIASIGPILALALRAQPLSEAIEKQDCYPNGVWSRKPDASWRIMHTSYFFIINLAYGDFSFTRAKVIDVVWDIGVSRGFQILLIYVTYRVFNDALVLSMELHPVSYKLYRAMAFEPTSLSALGHYFKGVFSPERTPNRRERFKRWLGLLSMLLSALYVMAFPTLASAMTGYTTKWVPYLQTQDGKLVEFETFRPVNFTIVDGYRLGLPDNYLLWTYEDVITDFDMTNYYKSIQKGSISDDKNQIEVNGTVVNLEGGPLNITIAKDNFYWVEKPEHDSGYSHTYLQEMGSCQPGANYQWGFSYIFLFMVSIFHCVWSLILYFMWMEVRLRSSMYRTGRRPGPLSSIMELAHAMEDEIGPEARSLSHNELDQRLSRSSGAMHVASKELRVRRTESFQSRSRRRKWVLPFSK